VTGNYRSRIKADVISAREELISLRAEKSREEERKRGKEEKSDIGQKTMRII